MINKLNKFVLILAIFLLVIFLFSRGKIYKPDELSYGVTFSKKQAQSLGLDWQELYIKIFNDLGVKKIRLAAYWDEVEPEENNYNWQDLDWQINEAKQRDVEIVLAVGGRLPRWPECHFPLWIKDKNDEERLQKTVEYIRQVINRYKDNSSIKVWQVENEPFLPNFGECPEPNSDFLDKEIALVRSLDSRPILVTDSGELSLWVMAAKRGDIFGTTMYRDTYSRVLKQYIHYPIEPAFFRFKKNISNIFAHPQKWIVIELQGEPWSRESFQNVNAEERAKTMDQAKFKEIIEFARLTGFKEFYLWGVEWWYWEKEKQNNPVMWEEAQILFNK
jgi:hypothetical protein